MLASNVCLTFFKSYYLFKNIQRTFKNNVCKIIKWNLPLTKKKKMFLKDFWNYGKTWHNGNNSNVFAEHIFVGWVAASLHHCTPLILGFSEEIKVIWKSFGFRIVWGWVIDVAILISKSTIDLSNGSEELCGPESWQDRKRQKILFNILSAVREIVQGVCYAPGTWLTCSSQNFRFTLQWTELIMLIRLHEWNEASLLLQQQSRLCAAVC